MPDRMTPEQVATLDAYEWVSRARRGESVPTVEQWEAAERLAELARNDAHPDSIVAKLANVISPPQPPPLPEIAACPYCGASCDLVGGAVQCRARCNYVGPARDSARASIETHNDVARKLRPEPQPEPVKRTCGECVHFESSPGARPCCHNMNGYGPGQGRVTLCPPSPTRDADECERWEPKP